MADRKPPNGGARMEIFRGDITTLDLDAIVNAANEALAPGAGVCGAIHRAAGPHLAEACRKEAPCPTGEARITPGFGLKASYVIHTVGPVWRGGAAGEEALLAACYRNSLDLAAKRGLRSIAFPALSTGVFGYPPDLAAKTAVASVGSWLDDHRTFEKVVFALFDAKSEDLYRHLLRG